MTSDHVSDEEIFWLQHEDLIEELIDRNQVQLPATFLPAAETVAIGNSELLCLVHPSAYTSCTRRSRGWVSYGQDGSFHTYLDGHFLWTHPVIVGSSSQTISFIERQRLWQPVHEVLAFTEGPTPIFFRDSNTRWL